MEKGLLEKEREEKKGDSGISRWSLFGEEVKRVGYLAGPMVTVTLSQYFLQIISMMMVGHLGKLALSSTAIAISLCAVSGFSVIVSLVFLSHVITPYQYETVVYQIVVFLLVVVVNICVLTFVQTVWNVMCTGNSMWTSIWSKAIQKIWCSNLHCTRLAYFILSSSDSFVDILGEAAHYTWPRPFDFTRSWKICCVHDPCSLCLRSTSDLGSILFDAKSHQSPCHKFLRYYLLPCGYQLVDGFQNWTR